jgi:hypothetical protein
MSLNTESAVSDFASMVSEGGRISLTSKQIVSIFVKDASGCPLQETDAKATARNATTAVIFIGFGVVKAGKNTKNLHSAVILGAFSAIIVRFSACRTDINHILVRIAQIFFASSAILFASAKKKGRIKLQIPCKTPRK